MCDHGQLVAVHIYCTGISIAYSLGNATAAAFIPTRHDLYNSLDPESLSLPSLLGYYTPHDRVKSSRRDNQYTPKPHRTIFLPNRQMTQTEITTTASTTHIDLS